MSLRSTLGDIADAIRSKTGKVDTMTPLDMPTEIASIPTGGEDMFKIAIENQAASEYEYYNDESTSFLFSPFTGTQLNRNVWLKSADLPHAQVAPIGAFQYCSNLVSVSMPQVNTIPDNAFGYCLALTSYTGPKVKMIYTRAFEYCDALTTVDIGRDVTAASKIFSQVFRGCTNFDTLILRGSTVPTLDNTNAFNNTKIAAGTGYIYVPSALKSTYEGATNWSTYNGQFRSLEDYTVDGTVTGALDPAKI